MKILRIIAATLALGMLASPARAEDSTENVMAQVRGFYKFYLHALNTDSDPLGTEHATMRRYISERFLKKMERASKIEGGLDADPFICAQDFDKAWEKNIRIKDMEVESHTATVQVELSGGQMDSHRLNLKLVDDGGTWKIDNVSDGDTR